MQPRLGAIGESDPDQQQGASDPGGQNVGEIIGEEHPKVGAANSDVAVGEVRVDGTGVLDRDDGESGGVDLESNGKGGDLDRVGSAQRQGDRRAT